MMEQEIQQKEDFYANLESIHNRLISQQRDRKWLETFDGFIADRGNDSVSRTISRINTEIISITERLNEIAQDFDKTAEFARDVADEYSDDEEILVNTFSD
jgi:hypothetical protein